MRCILYVQNVDTWIPDPDGMTSRTSSTTSTLDWLKIVVGRYWIDQEVLIRIMTKILFRAR